MKTIKPKLSKNFINTINYVLENPIKELGYYPSSDIYVRKLMEYLFLIDWIHAVKYGKPAFNVVWKSGISLHCPLLEDYLYDYHKIMDPEEVWSARIEKICPYTLFEEVLIWLHIKKKKQYGITLQIMDCINYVNKKIDELVDNKKGVYLFSIAYNTLAYRNSVTGLGVNDIDLIGNAKIVRKQNKKDKV